MCIRDRGSTKKVKVDISRSEQLEYAPVVKDVIVGYSDIEAHQLLCYPCLLYTSRCV